MPTTAVRLHQPPIAGRDNWFHARIRNRGAGAARHFMVTFQVKQFAGVQFTWPTDFLPAIAATGGFDLAPGAERIVSARWPAALVPPAGTHACWLAAVLARSDRPSAGAHVWEHGNLAQKNLTVIKVKRGLSFVLPFVLRGVRLNDERIVELVRPSSLVAHQARRSCRERSRRGRRRPTSATRSSTGTSPRAGVPTQVLDADDGAGLADAGFEIEQRQAVSARARGSSPGALADGADHARASAARERRHGGRIARDDRPHPARCRWQASWRPRDRLDRKELSVAESRRRRRPP